MAGALTAKFVENVKPPLKGERAAYADGVVEGLELRVGSRGTKSWTLRLRTIGGTRRRLALGRYPHVTLADAREKAIKALAAAMDGVNPALEAQNRKASARSAERTIESLADMFFVSTEAKQRTASTNLHEKGVWRNHLSPRLKGRSLAELTRAEARAAIREIAQRSGERTANYAHHVLRRIYNFGIREELVEVNPAEFQMLFKFKSRDRVFTEAEVRSLWKALEAARVGARLGVSEPTAIALRLCLVTLQRAGEVSGMHTDELDWATNLWTIPAHRSKNRRAHHVPLSVLGRRLVLRALSLATGAGLPATRKRLCLT